ncbi:glycosyltransferase family 4 protein [Flavobacterium hungaricum]|uniref:Glycosyltransferase family 1 protein n=1 Tax=Flavobacterium hungaricum TaxID=2082725 RepID=A0ABR9TR42_9FLAO|nr:glycosyltransferase family 4 protein [Flavobacterium hungaricum]MBE8727795.1 glycosyltransferase family 1 protein [Flavobacterium hungaricum]
MSNFLIITNVIHTKENNQYYGYSPYINEMNIWIKFADQVTIVAPLASRDITPIDSAYDCNNLTFKKVPDFSFTTLKNRITSLVKLPIIFYKIFIEMNRADHIHLRCPGNMGLIGCFVQVFFPSKTKTAKYAGNWDPESKQPWTYKLQKKVLSNTFLTKNMKVLVYGNWDKQSKNIKPFFTASYLESEKEVIEKDDFNLGIKFIFVGSLTDGKNPLYAVKLIEALIKKGYNVSLDLYGEGINRDLLLNYVNANNLGMKISLKGNHDRRTIKEAYQKSHFVILPSVSEGWPKAIAEGMFWGCVPIATKVSCIPYMLDNENRGILLEMDLEKDCQKIEYILEETAVYKDKNKKAADWSREYTLDVFQKEIKEMI